MRKRLCFVIPDFLTEEKSNTLDYCRKLIIKLAHVYEVKILTTSCCDITSEEIIKDSVWNTIPVKSFSVLKNILVSDDNSVSAKTVDFSPELVSFLTSSYDEFELFVFAFCCSYICINGLPVVSNKALLIPFTNDKMSVSHTELERIFNLPLGIIYTNEEEMSFIQMNFHNKAVSNIVAPMWQDVQNINALNEKYYRKPCQCPYVVCLADNICDCEMQRLIELFNAFNKNRNEKIILIFIGKSSAESDNGEFIFFNTDNEEEKLFVISSSVALIEPSFCEGIPIEVLKAFSCKKPVLVNGNNRIMKSLCLQCNGGLYYFGETDFIECLTIIVDRNDIAVKMGENGFDYVKENNDEKTVISKITDFINKI